MGMHRPAPGVTTFAGISRRRFCMRHACFRREILLCSTPSMEAPRTIRGSVGYAIKSVASASCKTISGIHILVLSLWRS